MEKIRFDQLDLSEEVLRAIEDMGFEFASPIQEQAIPFLLQGRDVIGQAQTGTGKTAAFGIPAIDTIDLIEPGVQVLVLCPTRELAMQVADELEKLARYKKKVRVLAIFGGASIEKQIQGLRKGVQIVVGTPGRIMDHLDRGTLHLNHVKQIILDEADEMLDMGFRDDIESILQELPAERQTVFFSATMAKPILDLTKKYQKNPEIVKVTKTELTVSNIDQRYFSIKDKDKTEVLKRLVDLHEPKLCLVFTNTKRGADDLVNDLQDQGFYAEALHGDMRQAQRTQVMNKFRQGAIQVLVATDVAARGIDVDDVEMVINYDVPLDAEYYVHRIGRTGRAGRAGKAFSFVTRREQGRLRDIEHFAKTKIAPDQVPTMKAIEEKKKQKFLSNIKKTIEEGALTKYISWVEELGVEGFSAVDMAAALIKMELHHQIGEEGAADTIERESFGSDRGDRDRSESRGGKRGSRSGGAGMARLFVNVGRRDKVSPKDIVGAIAGETGVAGKLIGEIEIYDKFSFVEVPQEHAEQIMKKMGKSNIKGNRVKMEVAGPKK